jgi:hypothetical protein
MKAWIIALALLTLLFLSTTFAFDKSSKEGHAVVPPPPPSIIINSTTTTSPTATGKESSTCVQQWQSLPAAWTHMLPLRPWQLQQHLPAPWPVPGRLPLDHDGHHCTNQPHLLVAWEGSCAASLEVYPLPQSLPSKKDTHFPFSVLGLSNQPTRYTLLSLRLQTVVNSALHIPPGGVSQSSDECNAGAHCCIQSCVPHCPSASVSSQHMQHTHMHDIWVVLSTLFVAHGVSVNVAIGLGVGWAWV